MCQYPNTPKSSKIAVFHCCRSWNTSVFLRPAASKNNLFYLDFGSKNFRCCVFATMRGKNGANADAFASILTMQWRKNTYPKRVRILTQLLMQTSQMNKFIFRKTKHYFCQLTFSPNNYLILCIKQSLKSQGTTLQLIHNV